MLLEHDLLPLLRDGDYETGFAVALACKDLGLAVDLARTLGVPVELSAVAEQVFRRARAAFGDTAGEMSPVRLYEEHSAARAQAARRVLTPGAFPPPGALHAPGRLPRPRAYPLSTPSGRRRATLRDRPTASTTPTTSATSL